MADSQKFNKHNLVKNSMKKEYIVVLIIIVFFIILFILIYTSQKTFYSIPTSYTECMKTDEKYNFQNRGRSVLECRYTVYEEEFTGVGAEVVDKEKYTQCVKFGGGQIGYGGDCTLHFYNPDFIFPKNFRECVDEKKGEFTEFNSSYRNYCFIKIESITASDKEIVNKLLDECIKQGGSYSDEFYPICYLEFKEHQ